MKVTKSTALRLIESYTNVYMEDRTEYVHVREAENNRIVLEVNVVHRVAKIYLDYAHDVYVYVRLPWDDAFSIKENVFLVKADGITTYSIFAMEVVE